MDFAQELLEIAQKYPTNCCGGTKLASNTSRNVRQFNKFRFGSGVEPGREVDK